MRVAALVLCAWSILPRPASAESMRCGKWIVNESMTSDEILQKCGEPQKKDVSKQDVFSKNPAGYSTKRGEQVIERWYYKPSSGSLTMMVKLMDGKVVSIERAD
jgi:Protein of unknown function (DUF2845)